MQVIISELSPQINEVIGYHKIEFSCPASYQSKSKYPSNIIPEKKKRYAYFSVIMKSFFITIKRKFMHHNMMVMK